MADENQYFSLREKVDILNHEAGYKRVSDFGNALELSNSALYAVGEKKKLLGGSYQPSVTISTKKTKDRIEIRVENNGNGIPSIIINDIFQPVLYHKTNRTRNRIEIIIKLQYY